MLSDFYISKNNKYPKTKMEAREWLNTEGEKLLKDVGIKKGYFVLDFGCGSGNYTILASKIVESKKENKKGKVYALDKNASTLNELKKKIKEEGQENIKILPIASVIKIPVNDLTMDVVLLYDVIHLVGRGKSSTKKDRINLYREVYRKTKKGGIISVYPSHLETHTDIKSNKEVIKEINEEGFKLRDTIKTKLVHDNSLVEGEILNFVKK